MGYTFLNYADIIHRINGGYMEDLEFMSDYELNQEADIYLDIETDSYLDDPRHDQAYYLNRGDY
jgi:hypothetical protein